MAHFAQVDANYTVLEVVVIDNSSIDNLPFPESEPIGRAYCQDLYGADTLWYQTSYSASFRVHYAGIGYIYDPVLNAFIPPKPYPSWVLNTTTCEWQAPVPYPDDGKAYVWDECTQSWVPVPPKPHNTEPPTVL